MRINFEGFGVFGFIAGLAVAGYSIYKSNKAMKDVSDKLGMSIEEIGKSNPVDIQKAMVERSIDRAADKEVHRIATENGKALSQQIRSDMDATIRSDVNATYSGMKNNIESDILNRVSDIDFDDMKKEIKGRVVDKAFREICGFAGLGRMVGNGSGMDLNDLKDVLNTVPSYERSSIIKEFAKRI